MGIKSRLKRALGNWLNTESPVSDLPPVDFQDLVFSVRPGDVVLVEGRTRVADVIRVITQSRWTHSALYIGTLGSLTGSRSYDAVKACWTGDEQRPLLVEGILGQGTIVTPLDTYQKDNLRICRADGIRPADATVVVEKVIAGLGRPYDMRQMFDLARFLLPWSMVPRRWRSSLFEHRAGDNTKTVCSTLIAEAYAAVRFPVLPHLSQDKHGGLLFRARNPRLYTPADFDYSPYFRVIKFPPVDLRELAGYRDLSWQSDEQQPGDVAENDNENRFK